MSVARPGAVLVSGGSRGIGAAVATLLGQQGWPVAVLYRTSRDRAETVATSIAGVGGQAVACEADVTDAEQTARAVAAAEGALGPLYGVVHCAGVAVRPERVTQTPWEAFDAHWRVQVQGAWHLLQAALPGMLLRRAGAWVFVLSAYLEGDAPGFIAPYLTAKHALQGLARAVAAEVAPRGVRVHTVSPCLTRTDMTAHLPEWFFEAAAAAGRLGTPQDTAEAVAMLLESGRV